MCFIYKSALVLMVITGGRKANSFLISPAVISHDVVVTIDALRNAAIPTSIGTTLAIGASEAVAGAVGGLASRGTANAIGDRKIDSVATKVSSTSAFFGTRGLLYGGGLLLGLPKPLASACASLIASIVSEEVKAIPRNTLSTHEIMGDVAKWLIYDGLIHMNHLDGHSLPISPVEIAYSFLFGCVSAMGGALTNDVTKCLLSREESDADLLKMLESYLVSANYPLVATEGAVLFGCYRIILSAIIITMPETLDTKLLLDQVVESLEEDVINYGESTSP